MDGGAHLIGRSPDEMSYYGTYGTRTYVRYAHEPGSPRIKASKDGFFDSFYSVAFAGVVTTSQVSLF